MQLSTNIEQIKESFRRKKLDICQYSGVDAMNSAGELLGPRTPVAFAAGVSDAQALEEQGLLLGRAPVILHRGTILLHNAASAFCLNIPSLILVP